MNWPILKWTWLNLVVDTLNHKTPDQSKSFYTLSLVLNYIWKLTLIKSLLNFLSTFQLLSSLISNLEYAWNRQHCCGSYKLGYQASQYSWPHRLKKVAHWPHRLKWSIDLINWSGQLTTSTNWPHRLLTTWSTEVINWPHRLKCSIDQID